jgi:hypothetical protein
MPENPHHPKLTALAEMVAAAEQRPDLGNNAQLAARAFLATAAAGECWIDRHSAVCLSRVIRGLLEITSDVNPEQRRGQ